MRRNLFIFPETTKCERVLTHSHFLYLVTILYHCRAASASKTGFGASGKNSNELKPPVTEPEKTQYPECFSKEEGNRILDKLLAAEKTVTDPEADRDSLLTYVNTLDKRS